MSAPTHIEADLRGKRAVVTGATSGIGAVTASELARLGAEVIVIARDEARGRKTLADVTLAGEQATRPQSPQHRLVMADFADLATVHQAAEEIRALGPLDILVNNAGLIVGSRTITVDGNELTFQVNHLAHFLLTNLLLDSLRAAQGARVIHVSSGAHARAFRGICFDDLTCERGYNAFSAYAQAKLANVLFAYEMARRFGDSGICSNAMHPGVVRTGFGKGWNDLSGIAWNLLSPLWLTPEQGADTAIWLAASSEAQDETGRYFYKRRAMRSSAVSNDEVAAKRLWSVSEELVSR